MKVLLVCLLVAVCGYVHAEVCFHGICDTLKKHLPPKCKGTVIKNGGFCGCYDVCAKQEGEECQARIMRGRLPLGTCDTGLVCQEQQDMMLGAGKCVKKAETKPDTRRSQTECQRRHILSMISMVVYRGQWFPRCDAQGLFEPQQCDNTGTCFCVDVHTGVVDESSKVQGAADCGDEAKQARSTQTLCQQRRIQSMIVQIVYRGQWFPKCDAQGKFEPQQCDNTGMCFCVDVHTGEIDESSKVLGAANCAA